MERRDFLKTTSTAAALFYFGYFISSNKAWGKSIEPIIKKWLKEISDISSSVQSGKISAQDWQTSIERLHSKIPLEDVLRFIDLDKAIKEVKYPKEKLGGVANVDWPDVEGLPKNVGFGHKLFIYRKRSVTPPHAHNNLVSAHLIIKGEIRVRTFDRVQDLDKALLLRPTRDQAEKIGSTVSMSDYKDNVHWFEGISDTSVSFDVPVPKVELNKKYRHEAEGLNQIFVDASVAPRHDGLLEAPIIKFDESVKRFA